LEKGEVDVDVQSLTLKLSEAIGDCGQSVADGGQVFQGLLQTKIFQVVA